MKTELILGLVVAGYWAITGYYAVIETKKSTLFSAVPYQVLMFALAPITTPWCLLALIMDKLMVLTGSKSDMDGCLRTVGYTVLGLVIYVNLGILAKAQQDQVAKAKTECSCIK